MPTTHATLARRGRALRALAIVAATLPLATTGCATAPPPGPLAGPPPVPGLWIASRAIGRDAAYVEVLATHRSRYNRVTRIALVGPNGQEVEAEQVRTDAFTGGYGYGYGHPGYWGPYGPWGSIGIGGSSRGRVGVGVGIAFPIGVLYPGWYGYRRVYRTRATIKVPAPATYLKNPAAWKVKVTFRHATRGEHTRLRPAPGVGPAAGPAPAG